MTLGDVVTRGDSVTLGDSVTDDSDGDRLVATNAVRSTAKRMKIEVEIMQHRRFCNVFLASPFGSV